MKLQKKRNRKRVFQLAGAGVVLLFIGIQFTGKPIDNLPGKTTTALPKEVHKILERSCFNCHSNTANLSWYDKVAPVSWLVKEDVLRARAAMNISQWNDLPPGALKGKLWAVLNMVKAGKMPLPHYLAVHPEAKITEADIQTIELYVRGLNTGVIVKDTLRKESADKEFDIWRDLQQKTDTSAISPNGVVYRDDFKHWEVMSMTTLYDNTIRVNYGNAITIKALKEKQINPFPDGAIVAKAVWEQVEGKHGEILPGKFVNVQIMEKNARKYTNTEGWGFAKFSTLELTPYGETADFAKTSCIGCHRLRAKETGYLFNIPLETKPETKTAP
ncbi:heme-binding domain-containing protein [Sinomicrobium sp. M5D2P17]